ncbi:hypothetical protein JTB14_019936 [Gonioctena quinquepunctata]|nr:hypothetical protein JTB14_019936 [Gonioctena quinquepunctata]
MEDKKGGSQYQELKSKQTSLISQLININRDERETPTGGTNALQTNNTNGISQIDNKNQLEGQTESEQDWKKVKSKRKPFKKIRGQGEDSEGKFKDIVKVVLAKYRNPPKTAGRPSLNLSSSTNSRVSDDVRYDNIGHLLTSTTNKKK